MHSLFDLRGGTPFLGVFETPRSCGHPPPPPTQWGRSRPHESVNSRCGLPILSATSFILPSRHLAQYSLPRVARADRPLSHLAAMHKSAVCGAPAVAARTLASTGRDDRLVGTAVDQVTEDQLLRGASGDVSSPNTGSAADAWAADANALAIGRQLCCWRERWRPCAPSRRFSFPVMLRCRNDRAVIIGSLC
jgi:hypothetical protein